jgi:hypothetical protein
MFISATQLSDWMCHAIRSCGAAHAPSTWHTFQTCPEMRRRYSLNSLRSRNDFFFVSVQMSSSKITQVFHRTVFPIHFVTPRVQRPRSPRSDLFQVSFSRTYYNADNPAYTQLYEENEQLKRERAEMIYGYNKFKELQKERQRKNWYSS